MMARRTEEAYDRPSLHAELLTLLTSPDTYAAALVLLLSYAASEAVPQHQRGAPRNSSGLLSNVYLDDTEQACPHAHVHPRVHAAATCHAHAAHTYTSLEHDDIWQACPMWLLLTLCFAVPCAVGLALAVLSPARGTPH